MTMVSIGDLARSMMLQRHTTTAKSDLARLAESLASGRHADQAAQARGDLGPLAAIEGALMRIDSWQSAATGLSGRLGAMQTALGALRGIADTQAINLQRLTNATRADEVDRAARDARDHLDAALGVLNARFGGQSVFAGTRGDGPAVVSTDDLLDRLWPEVNSAATAAEVRDRVIAWFEDPSGFAAQAYRGGSAQGAIAVGPGETAGAAVTASDPAIARTLAGLAMAALVDRGLFADRPSARQMVAEMAGGVLANGADARVQLAAGLGSTEQRLAEIQARNAAEHTALGIARSGMVSADPFATAADLESARVQLETLFAITSRLSGMSLLGYLR
jgi:flagellar hook-associated protein 3 FlgL